MTEPQQNKDSNRYLLTADGYNKLRQEIEKLEREVKEVGIKKGEAAGSGAAQWHDNPAYEELEHEERRLQHRLAEFKDRLAKAQIFDYKTDKTNSVEIGSKVTILFTATNEKAIYTITDSQMSDPSTGKISYQSPLGSILMEKRTGEVVEFRENKIEILEIE